MIAHRASGAGRVRIIINAAIAAVEEALLEPGNHPILRNQLEAALARLRKMLLGIEGGRGASDADWLGQMVGDQWDPNWPVTDAVLRATHAFTSLNDTR